MRDQGYEMFCDTIEPGNWWSGNGVTAEWKNLCIVSDWHLIAGLWCSAPDRISKMAGETYAKFITVV